MMQEIFKNGSTISYGKRKNLAPGIVEDYLILPDSTKGFTSDEKNNFEKICKSFSWTSTSNPGEILPPCYGFFPFGDGSSIIVARFIDDGRDNQGRADLLRVDAIKVPAQLFYELKSDLRLVFDSSIWKNIFDVENSMADSIVISSDDCDKVFELVKKNITVPLLVGCSKNFKFKPTSGKFNTFDINSKTVEEISVPVFAPPSYPRIPLPPPKSNSTVVGQTNLCLVVLLVLVVFGLSYFVYYLKKELKESETNLTNQTASLNKIITKNNKDILDLTKGKKKLIDDLDKEKLNGKYPLNEVLLEFKDNKNYEEAKKVFDNYKNDIHNAFLNKIKVEVKKDTTDSFNKWIDKLLEKASENLKPPDIKPKGSEKNSR